MIFSSLFQTKPRWQHKDATTRITAINDELSADNAEQLSILLELIEQDDSELVRRAALIKVGSFQTYLQTSFENNQEKIKQFATKQVHDILSTDHQLVLSIEDKRKVLKELEDKPVFTTSLLEDWFAHEQHDEIISALYNHINSRKTSSHFLSQSFNQKQNENFQLFLLSDVEDAKLLEKLSKKACNDAVTKVIESKLASIQAAIEKPQKLSKQLHLVLAKLQALKDVVDYGQYKKRKSILLHEWQALESDIGIFSQEEIDVFNTKYQEIMAHLDKLFVAKAENYKQQIIADKLAHDIQQDKKTFSQQLNDFTQLLTTEIFTNDALDEELFKAQLATLTCDIEASVLNTADKQSFKHQVKQLTERVAKIPEITEYLGQATQLIAKISQFTLPSSLFELNESQETYNQWLKSWRLIETNTAGLLPASIVQSQKQIVNQWQVGLKSLQAEQKDLFFQQKKKLQDIKRLLNNGKYKVCFGLFKGIQESFPFLSIKQQQQLQRDFDNVNEKLTDLSELEHFIATPRKKELLLAIQELVSTPLDNPNEQAEKVKAYRKVWNSLGHADADVDKSLNEEFNLLCEQAFAPCRLYYAEQDKLREQNLAQRQQILAQAESLNQKLKEGLSKDSTSNVDYKNLENQLNRLQREWQNCGDVDRNQYKQLQHQFKTVTLPVKEAISVFQQENISEKQALITKAEKLLALDDVYSAIETAKSLQQAWRTVGFAGNHKENQLWQKFRQVNDELFAKRAQLKSEQQEEIKSQQLAFETKLNEIEQAFSADDNADIQSIKLYQSQASELLEQIIAHKPVIKVIATRTERFIRSFDDLIHKQSLAQVKQNWIALFNLLSLQANSAMTVEELQEHEQFSQLSSFWQKRFLELLKLASQGDSEVRQSKTIEIEILAQKESPKECSDQRLKIQVKLMQDQMLSGNTIDLSKELVEWLMVGKLSDNDLPLIERLQSIYCD